MNKGKVGTNDLPPVDFTSYEAAVAWVERRLLSFPEDCVTQPDKSNQQNTELNQISICHHWLHLLSFVRRCISPPVRRAGRLSLFRLSLSAVYHVTLPADSLKKCFSSLTKNRHHADAGPYFHAGDRTRTCTVSHRDLNPARLPIPPRPRSLSRLIYLCEFRRLVSRNTGIDDFLNVTVENFFQFI